MDDDEDGEHDPRMDGVMAVMAMGPPRVSDEGLTLQFGWRGDMVMTSGAELTSGWIPGTPAPLPRPRFVRGRVVSWRAAGRATGLWRARVVSSLRTAADSLGDALEGVRGGCDLAVSLRFVFPTVDQALHGAPHTRRPDTDNLAKLWMDVAQEVGLLLGQDDASVAGLESWKVWGAVGGCGWTLRALERVEPGQDRVAAGRWWETDAPEWVGGER
jgi:Holliday junction resolvase RusA-like endonuclease